jgi:hypothetical protein
MSNRLTDFIIKENYKKLKKLKEEILFRSRKEVEINGKRKLADMLLKKDLKKEEH